MIKWETIWYRKSFISWPFIPLSFLFFWIIKIRQALYKKGILKTHIYPLPVIVVGNITVGGTGKTPLVIHIVELLKAQQLKPGIISRGYKGAYQDVMEVFDTSDPHIVGDEPLLMAKRLKCPMVISRKRIKAIEHLLEKYDVDVVISDDGLQHYALGRQIEIAVIDGLRKFGNGYLLPAGPLREPVERLKTVNCIVNNGGSPDINEYSMRYQFGNIYNLSNSNILPLSAFKSKRVHAIAGIGNPARFFNALMAEGLQVIEHSFPDHHVFDEKEINFQDDLPVVMTEKDAVKCRNIANSNHWALPIDIAIDSQFDEKILTLIRESKNG